MASEHTQPSIWNEIWPDLCSFRLLIAGSLTQRESHGRSLTAWGAVCIAHRSLVSWLGIIQTRDYRLRYLICTHRNLWRNTLCQMLQHRLLVFPCFQRTLSCNAPEQSTYCNIFRAWLLQQAQYRLYLIAWWNAWADDCSPWMLASTLQDVNRSVSVPRTKNTYIEEFLRLLDSFL